MNQSSAKAAAIAVALVTTWTSAAAQEGRFELTPNEQITDFRTVAVNLNQGSSTVQELAVGPNVGAISADTTILTATPALAPSASSPDHPYAPTSWAFGLGLATDGGLVLTSSVAPGSHPATPTFANLLTGNFGAFSDFVRSGDTAQITALIDANVNNGGPEGMMSNDITRISFNRENPNQNGSLIKFSRESSNIQMSGLASWSNQPVPEPASMAVLGLGLAALRQRRRSGPR